MASDVGAAAEPTTGQGERQGARAFWTYWTASATSMVGSSVGAVALPLTALLVLDATALEMGLIAASAYVAWLVIGLPAGVVTQRFPLRRLQVSMDLLRALAVASIPVAWWFDRLTIAQLVVTALVSSFASVLFDVANSTFLPSVVPREQLQARNSLMSGTHAASQLGGPSLGGVAVQLLGAVPTLLVDAASYVVSALLLRRLPDRSVPASPDRPPMGQMVREGWHFVTRHPIMGPCMWDATATNFVCGGQMALFALYLVRDLEAPAGLVGFLLAAEGIGSLAGAALVPLVVRRFGSARACLAGGVVSVVGSVPHPGRPGRPGARRVRRRQRRLRGRGGRAEHHHPDLPADRQPSGDALAGDGHGALRVLGRDPPRRAGRRRAGDLARRPRGARRARRVRRPLAGDPAGQPGPAPARLPDGAGGLRHHHRARRANRDSFRCAGLPQTRRIDDIREDQGEVMLMSEMMNGSLESFWTSELDYRRGRAVRSFGTGGLRRLRLRRRPTLKLPEQRRRPLAVA